jgi:hypothetical protein
MPATSQSLAGVEVAARPRAVEDDSVAAVVGGERLDDLGKRLLFVHGRILARRAFSVPELSSKNYELSLVKQRNSPIMVMRAALSPSKAARRRQPNKV